MWNVGGIKGGEDELREKPGATLLGCCVGEDSGELLAKDDLSDALEIDTSCCDESQNWDEQEEVVGDPAKVLTSVSVSRLGQNSISSSKSKERTDSNLVRKASSDVESDSSFMLRTPRNCR